MCDKSICLKFTIKENKSKPTVIWETCVDLQSGGNGTPRILFVNPLVEMIFHDSIESNKEGRYRSGGQEVGGGRDRWKQLMEQHKQPKKADRQTNKTKRTKQKPQATPPVGRPAESNSNSFAPQQHLSLQSLNPASLLRESPQRSKSDISG